MQTNPKVKPAGLSPRDYRIEEYTTTVCPACFAKGPLRSDGPEVFKDGMLVSRNGSIYMRRFCGQHGETESLYEESSEIWKARDGWQTPTLKVIPDRAANFGVFPAAYRDGLPASHGQHTCILLLNVTQRCNYACTTCYASAKSPDTPAQYPELPAVSEILHTVHTVLERENNKLGVLMLSGGEPTVRADLGELLTELVSLPINRIMINTNGRRIARDDDFLNLLETFRDRVEVYLQFDGFRKETYETLRGQDVAREKVEALERLDRAGVFTTLVMTVAKGVNEDEVGDVLVKGLSLRHCAGMAIQPVFGSGRGLPIDPMNRTTPTGVLKRLAAQTGGLIDHTDFIPLPCSHKDCCDITYLLKDEHNTWKSLPKLIGKDKLRQWIDQIANTISFEQIPADVARLINEGLLQRVFSEQIKSGSPDIALDIARMCGCIPGLVESLGTAWNQFRGERPSARRAAEATFRVTVKMFMDAHTFHAARIKQCCVHTGTFESDPRRYSFCWRWLFADAEDFPGAM